MAAHSKIFRSAFVVMAALVLVKPLNFAKEIIVAAFFGTSGEMDIFFTSLIVPLLIAGAIGGLFQAAVIPVFNDFDGRDDERNAWFSSVLNVSLAALFLFTIILIFSVKYLAPVFAPGFKGARQETLIALSYLALPTIFFLSGAALYKSWLEAIFDFKTPVVLQGSIAVCVIVFVLIGKGAGVYSVAAGNLAGAALFFVLTAAAAAKKGFRYSFSADIGNPAVRKVFLLMAPLVIGTAFTHINVAVDIAMASLLKEGSVSALSYADKMMIALRSFFILSLSTVVLPFFSKNISEGKTGELEAGVDHAVRFSAIFLIPLTIFFVTMAGPAVEVVFKRGAFNAASAIMTARAFACYSLGLFPIALVFVIPRVFYALKDNGIVMIVAGLGSVLNVILNYILMKPFGHAGIALSTSIVYAASAGMFFYFLKKRMIRMDVKKYIRTAVSVLIGSLAAAALMTAAYNLQFVRSGIYNLILALLVYLAVYVCVMFFLSREDFKMLINSLLLKR